MHALNAIVPSLVVRAFVLGCCLGRENRRGGVCKRTPRNMKRFAVKHVYVYTGVPFFRFSRFRVSACGFFCVLSPHAVCRQEYIERDFSKDEFEVWQYPVFAAMGVLCGFVGPLYVNFRLNMLKVCNLVWVPASSPPPAPAPFAATTHAIKT